MTTAARGGTSTGGHSVWTVGGVLLLALACRFLAAYFQPRPNYFWHTDTTFYWGDAVSLATSGTLKYMDVAPPGLGMILAVFVLLGMSPFQVTLLVQPVVGTLSVWLGMRVTEHLFDRRAGLVCGLMLAVYPPLLNLTRQLITETWFIGLLMLATWLLLKRQGWLSFVAGVAGGLAAMVRVPGLGVIFVTTTLLAARPALRPKLAPYLVGVGCMLTCGVAVQSHTAGAFVVLGQAAQGQRFEPVLGGYRHISDEEALARGSYVQFMGRHPLLYVKERGVSLLSLLSPWPLDNGRDLRSRLVIATGDGLVFLLAILAVSRLRMRWRRPDLWLVCAPVVGLCVFYGLTFSQPRYRWSFMPFVICLSTVLWARKDSGSVPRTADDLGAHVSAPPG